MEADAAAPAANGSVAAKPATPEPAASKLPEVEAYASLLVLLLLTDGKHWAEVRDCLIVSCEVIDCLNSHAPVVLAV